MLSLKSIYSRLFPAQAQNIEDSVWIGPFRDSSARVYLALPGIIAFLGFCSFISTSGDLGGRRFSLFLIALSILALLPIFSASIKRPFRIDFKEQSMSLIYWNRRMTIALTDIKECRYERNLVHVRNKSRTSTFTNFDLTFEFKEKYQDRLKIPRGNHTMAWLALMDQLKASLNWRFHDNKTQMPIPFTSFGSGADRLWFAYLNDNTSISVRSPYDIQTWLATCKYAFDSDQFGKEDHWLSPAEFEGRKVGDCEDHALWAWHKLYRLGIPAEFVVGMMKGQKDDWEGHAWVMLYLNGSLHLLESTNKNSRMFIPWDKAKERYRLRYAVNHQQETFEYRDKD